jgi:hypothetical protein
VTDLQAWVEAIQSDDTQVRFDAEQQFRQQIGDKFRQPDPHADAMLNAAVALVIDKSTPDTTRQHLANFFVSYVYSAHHIEALKQIAFDPDESICVRSEVIEWILLEDKESVEFAARLFSDEAADVRFWAAFRLVNDIPEVITHPTLIKQLDQIAAHDARVPTCFGWHVHREALCALEKTSAALMFPKSIKQGYSNWQIVTLISPAAEYSSFMYNYRTYTETRRYDDKPAPSVDFRVDPEWLREKIASTWKRAKFDQRKPKLDTYLLDWRLAIDRQPLIGGLHRDGYGVVLTSRHETPAFKFAAWYRNLFADDQPMFFYEWAGSATPLTKSMTWENLAREFDTRDDRLNQMIASKAAQTETKA